MQPLSRVITCLALLGVHTADAYRKHLRHSDVAYRSWGSDESISIASGGTDGKGGASGTASLETTVQALVDKVMQGKGLPDRDVMKAVQQMNINDAMQRLNGKIPADVASLVRMTSGAAQSGGTSPYSEESLQKARRILNGMIETSRTDLDDVELDCHVFITRNRMTFGQVKTDLARFSSQLAKRGEERIAASECIAEEDRKRKELERELEEAEHDYSTLRIENERDMVLKKNDLAVFDFILSLTKCKDGSLLQLRAPSAGVKVCSTSGGLDLRFDNPALQAKVERMMTPTARKALHDALGGLSIGEDHGKSVLLQAVQSPTTLQNTTTPAIPTYNAEETPVSEEPNPIGQWKKCVDGPYNCGLLHDLMSLQWGKFRDEFDSLSDEMSKNQDDFNKLSTNLNEQLTVSNNLKTGCMTELAEAISAINTIQEEEAEKTEQHEELDHEFVQKKRACEKKIKEILFTNICAVRKIRNTVMKFSTDSPLDKISDCDVTDWVAAQCKDTFGAALECDDSCPKKNPFACGGSEVISREVVVAPNEFGIRCPPLKRERKCNQKKCPVSCELSQWSGWSGCTAQCDGGQQEQTRSILTKAKNGGQMCDTVQEERNCNTLSCYRDCSLSEWEDWGFCSMACSMPGYTGSRTRVKSVVVPIRGSGKCPGKKHHARYEVDECNTQLCAGDEVCTAKQDLIIALDASGSLREEGFKALQNFAGNLTGKFKSEYFGFEAMRVGVVLFGNGDVKTLPDGSTYVQAALNIQSLTADMNLVKEKILGQTWQRGFTNMAQAFEMANTMLQQGGRPEAQSAVIVISDGQYSMKYQTEQKARELRDNNVVLMMAAVTDTKSDDLKTLRSWASRPRRANFERIPGLEALEYNPEMFAQRILAKFCPDAVSPSEMIETENERQYMLIHEDGWPDDQCGPWIWLGKQPSKEDCGVLAREKGKLGFTFGKELSANDCYARGIEVTEETWSEWQKHRENPPCPGGAWLSNPYHDTYVLKPELAPGVA